MKRLLLALLTALALTAALDAYPARTQRARAGRCAPVAWSPAAPKRLATSRAPAAPDGAAPAPLLQDPTKPPPPPPPTKPPPPPPPTEPKPGGGGNQPQPQPSDTPVPPPLPTATAIATRRPVATRTPTLTATPSDTPTVTPSPTPSETPTPSRTPRPDYLAPVTWTPSATNPPSATPSPTPTRDPLAKLPTVPDVPLATPLISAMARFPWLPAALGGLLLAGAAALRRLSPRWILAGLAVTVLAVVVFGLEWSPGQAMGEANLETLTTSGTWQISLAVLAAVVVTLAGGWIAGRVNQAQADQQPVEAGEEAEDDLPEEAALAMPMPPLFMAGGARLLITGPSRSGKSTILHNLIRYALADSSFDEIVLLDGKGPELVAWSKVAPECTEYHGPEDIAAWVAPLERIAGGLAGRYAAMVQGGQRKAEVGTPRKLVIIDEIQKATRTEHGKRITAPLLTINEQSGALGDVVIITTQRATHRALDKSISYNASQVITLKSPDYPGRFDLLRAIDQKKAVRRGLARPADDADVAAWVAEVAEARAERLAKELWTPREERA